MFWPIPLSCFDNVQQAAAKTLDGRSIGTTMATASTMATTTHDTTTTTTTTMLMTTINHNGFDVL